MNKTIIIKIEVNEKKKMSVGRSCLEAVLIRVYFSTGILVFTIKVWF